ncbi:MAG: hypothetical protein IT350_08405 [Deltaproteobacteria bacterium]|nr:hypothetical protein [Deltaproteobacteria bacterium]
MAEEAIGVVLIGAGPHARVWCEAYRPLAGVHLVGVYDDDPDAATRLARQFPELAVFRSLGDVLGNSEVWIAEIDTPVLEALDVAEKCLESGISVGIRGTALHDATAVDAMVEAKQAKVALRVYSPAHYSPIVTAARELLNATRIGDVQTLRVRSVAGRHGRADEPIVTEPLPAAPIACGPEFEALPLAALLGPVRAVHAWTTEAATLVTWHNAGEAGARRFGVYEAVRAPGIVVRGPLEPVAESFEFAGTDGYIFGGALTGRDGDGPALATYIGDRYEVPIARFDEDPTTAYRAAAADLVRAARYRSKPEFADLEAIRIARFREAIRESIRTGQEALLTDSD